MCPQEINFVMLPPPHPQIPPHKNMYTVGSSSIKTISQVIPVFNCHFIFNGITIQKVERGVDLSHWMQYFSSQPYILFVSGITHPSTYPLSSFMRIYIFISAHKLTSPCVIGATNYRFSTVVHTGEWRP